MSLPLQKYKNYIIKYLFLIEFKISTSLGIENDMMLRREN